MAQTAILLALVLLLVGDCHCTSRRIHQPSEVSMENPKRPGPGPGIEVNAEKTCSIHKEAHQSLLEFPKESCRLTRMEAGKPSKVKCPTMPRMMVFEFFAILHDLNTSDYREAFLFLHPYVGRVRVLAWNRHQPHPISLSALCDSLHRNLHTVDDLESSRTASDCLKFDVSHIVHHFLQSTSYTEAHLVVAVELQPKHMVDKFKPFIQVISNDEDSEDSDFCENGLRILASSSSLSTTQSPERRSRSRPRGRSIGTNRSDGSA